MILGDHALRELVEFGRLRVAIDGEYLPPDSLAIEPASIDLHLARDWKVPRGNSTMGAVLNSASRGMEVVVTDITKPINYDSFHGDQIIIPGNGFVLARTIESVELPSNLAGFIEGRSSIGRAGLFIHNAGWTDPGFRGTLTLELYNALPNAIAIPAGMRICQIVIAEARGVTPPGYQGKYNDQQEVTGSMVWKDFR